MKLLQLVLQCIPRRVVDFVRAHWHLTPFVGVNYVFCVFSVCLCVCCGSNKRLCALKSSVGKTDVTQRPLHENVPARVTMQHKYQLHNPSSTPFLPLEPQRNENERMNPTR
jgi:hypothetical protein